MIKKKEIKKEKNVKNITSNFFLNFVEKDYKIVLLIEHNKKSIKR
jgi:hypothetical protein